MTAAVRRPVWHKNSKPVQNNPLHILIYVQMLFALQLKWQTAALDQQETTGTLLPSGENKNFFAEATNLLSLHSYFSRENLCAPFCWLSGAFMQRNIRDVNVLTVWWTCWHFQPSGWISVIKGIFSRLHCSFPPQDPRLACYTRQFIFHHTPPRSTTPAAERGPRLPRTYTHTTRWHCVECTYTTTKASKKASKK